MTVLAVDCAGFEAASLVLGREVAQALAADAGRLLGALDACAGMAGSDPAGAGWGTSYDDVVDEFLQVVQDSVNAGFRLAGLLQQSGFNYAAADAASVVGGRGGPDLSSWAGQSARVGRPPSAVGVGGDLPDGWRLISGFVDAVWPDGHQDRLRAAASAWRLFGGDVRARSYDVTRAYADIDAQAVPESPVAHERCALLAAHLALLADHAATIAGACDDYAHQLDEAHSDAIDELRSFVEWTVAIEATGGLLAVVTVGLSEVGAQAAEAARASVVAARVGAIVLRLQSLARDVAFALQRLAPELAFADEVLRPLAAVEVRVAETGSAATRMTMAGRAGRGAGGAVPDLEARLARLPEQLRVDLAKVDPTIREDTVATLERIARGVEKFPGRDAKKFDNDDGLLPIGGRYREWIIVGRRDPHRLIIDGPETNPVAVYYWNHEQYYILIGPA